MTGAARGTHCAVCNDGRAATINAAINSGMSDRRVAADFGLTRSKVLNHRRSGHDGVEPPDVALPAFRSVEGRPRDKLQNLIDHSEAQLATAAGSHRIDLVRELRIAYNDLEKMSGGAGPDSVAWRDVEGLPELLARLTAALEAYPEARLAMLAAMDA